MSKRVLLKISGESLRGSRSYGVDSEVAALLAGKIQLIQSRGYGVGLVLGGGNFIRGKEYEKDGMDRTMADYAGMLATVINGLIFQNALIKVGLDVRTMSAISINRVAEPFVTRRALRHMSKGRVVLFVGGSGNPFMSTDTASALRALEIEADFLLIAKNGTDGVYDSDPKINPNAKHFKSVTAQEYLKMGLEAMDPTAVTLCVEHGMPMVVFDIFKEGNLEALLDGKQVGTKIITNVKLGN